MIDYTKFQLSLKRLEEQYENYRHLDPSLPRLTSEAVPESVVRRFKTSFDSLWKVLRRYLAEELGVPEVPSSPKPLLRLASESDLLVGPLEDWLDYARHRVEIAQDCSVEKVARCVERRSALRVVLTSSRTAPPASGRSRR